MRAAGIIGLAVLVGAAALAQNGRKVTGVVVAAATRQPVANAQVSYAESGRRLRTTRTDSKGRFEIPNSGVLGGVVTVAARRFGTSKRAWPPREGSELRFALTPPATASGTIADLATGRAVEGRVTLVVRHPLNLVSSSTRTRGGAFRFDDLPPGPAVIYAQADGFAPYFGALTIDAGKRHETGLGVLLEAAASGRVLDRDGSPATDARVSVRYSRTLPGGGILAGLVRGNVVADANGTFRVGGLVPDTPIAVQAELEGRLSDVVTISVEPGMEQQGLVLRVR